MDGGPPRDPRVRLHAYRIRQPSLSPPREVRVRTAFGVLSLKTTRAAQVLLPAVDTPASPAGRNLDPYKCYRTRRVPGGGGVAGAAEFTVAGAPGQALSLQIGRPEYLCRPASLEGARIENPDEHLLCFAVRSSSGVQGTLFEKRVGVTDLARADRLTTFGVRKVCVAARFVP
jgi:hypothetical protein